MRRILALLLTVALLAAACGGDGSEETTTTADDSADTTAAPDTTEPADDTTTTEARAATTTTQAAEGGGGGEGCIAGTWELNNEAFLEQMTDLFSQEGMPEADVGMIEGGTFTVDLGADGSLNSMRENWGFDVMTAEGNVQIVINGTESGTWSADGTTMTIDITDSDLVSDTNIVVDGQEVPLPGGAPVDVPEGFATESEYTCSDDTLSLTNAGIVSELNRR